MSTVRGLLQAVHGALRSQHHFRRSSSIPHHPSLCGYHLRASWHWFLNKGLVEESGDSQESGKKHWKSTSHSSQVRPWCSVPKSQQVIRFLSTVSNDGKGAAASCWTATRRAHQHHYSFIHQPETDPRPHKAEPTERHNKGLEGDSLPPATRLKATPLLQDRIFLLYHQNRE